MVIAMADKLWIGTQTQFDNRSSYALNDIFSTKSTSSYKFNYHDTCSIATLASWDLDTFITVQADGTCVANSGALVAANPISVTNTVLYRFYRGEGGKSAESLFGTKTVSGETSPKSLADITAEVRNKYFY